MNRELMGRIDGDDNRLVEIARRLSMLPLEKQKAFHATLRAKGIDPATLPVVRRSAADRAQAPLSDTQRRLWFLDQLEGPSAAYNIHSAIRLTGSLDSVALKGAFGDLLMRHPALRTAIVTRDGEAVQMIAEAPDLPWREVDLSTLAPAEREKALGELGSDMADRPFDLARAPLMRLMLARTAANEHVLWLTLHHIVADGWSMDIMLRELSALYAARIGKQAAGLPDMAIDHVDHALWQRDMLRGEMFDRQLDYWRGELGSEQPVLILPTDRPRSAQAGQPGATCAGEITGERAGRLRELARREGCTLFAVLLAAYDVLLFRLTGQGDIRVGTPVANRERPEIQGLVGLFANTLVLRAELAGGMRFRKLLGQVMSRVVAAQAHQDVPFEVIVDALQPERDLAHAPLFQTMLTVHAPRTECTLAGLHLTEIDTVATAAKFDLTLEIIDTGDRLLTRFHYRSALFDSATIERMSRHFGMLLDGIVAGPDRRIDQLPILTAAETHERRDGHKDTAHVWTAEDDHPVHRLFERQARQTPDAPALHFGDDILTYRELDERSNCLSHHLRGQGVTTGDVVGVCLERSVEMVVALLAVMKAGAAYLPLDPDYPHGRLDGMCRDAGLRLIITAGTVAWRPQDEVIHWLELDAQWPDIMACQTSPLSLDVQGAHLAYVIYTSGSTGRPKGVAVPHAGLTNRLLWMQSAYGLGPEDRVLQKTPFSFDVSVWEFFWPLMTGAALVVAMPGDHRDSERLVSLIREHKVTTLHFVPSMLRAFLEDDGAAGCNSLQRIICSGEALPFDLQQRCLATMGASLHNLYGPTEASIDVSHWTCDADAGGAVVPIGRPVANMRMQILDASLNLVPVGVTGEIYLGGIGLARGYLGRPDLTADRFIADPFSTTGADRLYRTGDLGRWRPDGSIEYLGRADQQVKIRGFRIELGEIEAQLLASPSVNDGVVVARPGEHGDMRLVAYWTATDDAPVDEEQLRAGLRASLPDHMVPSAFVRLPAIPLSVNGKVDRKALPAPVVPVPAAGPAPRSPAEQILAGVWQDVLGLERVGLNDNFFRIGGDSILSLQVVARARRHGLRLTPRQMFEHQTVADAAALAEWLDEAATAPVVDEVDDGGAAPLTPIQQWFFEENFRSPDHWNQAMVLSLRERVDMSSLQAAFADLMERHPALRQRFHRQPDGTMAATRAASDGGIVVERIDLGDLPADDLAQAVEAQGDRMQAALRLERGPLLAAALIVTGPDRPDRLLIVAHHLVIDGVSWRILLEELETLCRPSDGMDKADLPEPGGSYRRWARRLREQAAGPEAMRELPFWQSQGDAVASLPLHDAEPCAVGQARSVRVRLDPDRTARLVGGAAAVLRARIDEVMLAALSQTLCSWADGPAVLVEMEGHGREDLFADLDIGRTIGWFTSRFPVRLGAPADNPLSVLKRVKEQLRAVPRNGIGYGILRHAGDAETRALLAASSAPEVCFNYLGRFDRVFHDRSLFALAPESGGSTRSPLERRSHALDIDGIVQDGALIFDWTYDPGRIAPATAERLATDFTGRLAEMIDALSAASPGVTPSDFPLAALQQDDLDAMAVDWSQIENVYPVAPMQHGLLLHTLLNPGVGMYLMQDRYRLCGEVEVNAFVHAWERVVARHPVLRTAFHWANEGEPLQLAYRSMASPVSLLDWSALAETGQRARLDRLLAEELAEGFDLAQPKLLRFRLICLGENSYYFTQSYHHILIDAWCFSLMMVDFFAHYQALREGRQVNIPLPRPYADFIEWLGRQDRGAARTYWRDTLDGFAEVTPLGIIEPPSPDVPPGVEDRSVHLDAGQTVALAAQAQQHQLTANTYVQAAWALLLGWYSGKSDILFGTTVAGRPPELEGAEASIGLFINTLPLRLALRPDQRVADWLREVMARNVRLRQHEYLSLAEVQALSPLGRGQSLFDSLFVFENAPVDSSLDEWKLRWQIDEKAARTHTNYPITVVIIPGDRLTLQITYDRQRFAADAIDRMLGHFKDALLALMASPDERLCDLPLMTAEDRALVDRWNDGEGDSDICVDFSRLFEAEVRRQPDAPAARCGDETLTYAELNRRANGVGHALIDAGIGPDDVVALHDQRGLDLLVMILGVFKAGAAYLPLDPAHPSARLEQVLRLSGCALLLSGRREDAALAAAMENLGDKGPPHLALTEMPEEADLPDPIGRGGAATLAYIIYTSGSTGIPKGAMVERLGMMNTLLQKHGQLGLGATDVIAQTAPACFDISVWQFLSGLLCGALIEIVPDAIAQDPEALGVHVRDRGITILECVPSLLRGMLAGEPGDSLPLRWLLPTGEALPPDLAREWLARHPGIPLLNVYGPAECADDVALHALHDPAETHCRHLPIGRPVRNLRLHVVNQRLDLVPVGVPGELCVAGVGVGRGYLNDPSRTAAVFLPNPFDGTPGSRLYCTGDLVRQRPDGILEFLGRVDHQVKVRGYRIELGEIESRLRAIPGIADAVVLVREVRPGDQRIVAYVTGMGSSPDDLRAALAADLPHYMVPAAVLMLDRMPLNANGKVDRKALPAPQRQSASSASALQEPPRTDLHRRVSAIWTDVLGIDAAGIHDDFFALGGHSLIATQLVSRVRRAFDVELPLRAVFDAPTIAALADAIIAAPGAGKTLVLQPRDRSIPAPLSFAQERMWFLSQMDGGRALYNMPVALELRGPLDPAVLEQALEAVETRHEVLRTHVQLQADGLPYQHVRPPERFTLPMDDLTGLPPQDRERQADTIAADHACYPFDLETDVPWRARLLVLEPQRHRLLLTLHHIAGDGWSLDIWMAELACAYQALLEGEQPAWSPLPVQYADYAVWQRQRLDGAMAQRQLGYWRNALGDAPVILELPTDRPRPPVARYRGGSLDFTLDAELADGLRRAGEVRGATLFMTLLAAYGLLLHRYSGQSDIRIGTPIANRQNLETEGLIGLFVNTLVMRLVFPDGDSFDTLLDRVRETTLGAQMHQDLPFERLVEALQPERDLSRAPLFQTMLTVHKAARSAASLPGLDVHVCPSATRSAKFDLSLMMNEAPDGRLDGSFEYDGDLFDRATIDRMARHFQQLLRQVAQWSCEPLADWSLMDARDRALLVEGWNRIEDGRTPLPVASAFEEQARSRPDAVALIARDGRFTYAQVDARADALAWRLRAAGAGPGMLVGLFLPRSSDLVVSLLAIFKTGAAYLPLDPVYPQERLRWMLDDARPPMILTQDDMAGGLPPHAARVLRLDRPDADGPPVARDGILQHADPAELAYCIYTSGSTGRPKGVQVTRRGLDNLLCAMQPHVQATADDMWLAITSLSFDIAALELYLPLVTGGSVLLADGEQTGDASALMRLLDEHPVTIMQATPASWRMMIEAGWQGRRDERGNVRPFRLLCGGEAMGADLARALRGRSDLLLNVYGPTETAIWSTCHMVVDDGVVSIGRPIANTRIHILDPRLAPVPPGVAGELCIGGAGLARGYAGRADLTAERFIPDPFRPGERLYRSGDMACWRADGSILCLGRTDRQIKLRGYRIELDEIEATLAAAPGVAQGAVRLVGDQEPELVAYVVPRRQEPVEPAVLREMLARSLPRYMVPTRFVQLDAMPLTPNGKVDRQALPMPEPGIGSQAGFVAPATPMQALAVNIWEEMLGLPRVGIHDNFFHLGGHSLLAVRVMQRLRQMLGREMPLTLLFKAPTPAGLAAALEADDAARSDSPLIALRDSGDRRPLFCIHPAGGHVASYLPLVHALDADQPVYGLQSRRLHDPAWQDQSIDAMATDYVEALRGIQPHGPYRLLGWSLGGLVAQAMAVELERRGESVEFLGLLDAPLYRDGTMAQRHHLADEYLDHIDALLPHPLPTETRLSLHRELVTLDAEGQRARLLMWLEEGGLLPPEALEEIGLQVRVSDDANRLMREHNVRPVRAPIHIWWAEQTLSRHEDGLADWSAFTQRGVHSSTRPGDHWGIMQDSLVHRAVAQALADMVSIEIPPRHLENLEA